jgi:hypothetical protein
LQQLQQFDTVCLSFDRDKLKAESLIKDWPFMRLGAYNFCFGYEPITSA